VAQDERCPSGHFSGDSELELDPMMCLYVAMRCDDVLGNAQQETNIGKFGKEGTMLGRGITAQSSDPCKGTVRISTTIGRLKPTTALHGRERERRTERER